MRVLVDEDMPYACDLSSRLGEVIAVPGYSTPAARLADVNALMVRSVTKVNESLLAGESIKFAGTATAGASHVNETWLKQAGTGFPVAPGCNAIVVVEYVFFSPLTFAERDGFPLYDRTVEIMGVGNVGCRLQARLEALGIKTLLCDPLCVDCGDEGDFCSLDELVQHVDIPTFRAPLLKDGPYRALYLADEKLIRSLKPGAILISVCYGVVIDNTALLACLNENQKLSAALDVWEGEPGLNVELLIKVDIGTPHIAGYTLEGKTCGTT